MHHPLEPTNLISSIRTSVSRPPLRPGILFIAAGLACLALSPAARAVSPPPDGDYANGNTAEGMDALFSLTTGSDNTAIGFDALFNNTTGAANTATGNNSLLLNTTGSQNTANGRSALVNNTTGGDNTANGDAALFNNTTGIDNTATGSGSLLFNTTGSFNTANGVSALVNNTTGGNNTASGFNALFNNTTGSNNIGLGLSAGSALTIGNNNIDIGSAGVAGESGKIRIGTRPAQKNTFIAGISGVTVAGGVGVIIDTNGHLGTITSSKRFKDEIKPMDKASEAILALKPVTFRYKHELDPDGIRQFGLVAEQVEQVNPELVARDEQGKAYTVRYEAVNAMLLNEFLKEHRKVDRQERMMQEQETAITQLKATVSRQEGLRSTIAQQQKQIDTLTSQIQKVSDQLAVSQAAPRVVINK
ncbi:MAG: tail fiber domain-containing protein [Chthoniobacterales bacterium]|nr:tail fiber domain-containing protein [Chthoniobacterales bacterium]